MFYVCDAIVSVLEVIYSILYQFISEFINMLPLPVVEKYKHERTVTIVIYYLELS